jgi:thiosulfate dehydrogenase [quinone] large subunit
MDNEDTSQCNPVSTMTDKTSERALIFLLRMSMAWTFLYAASHQVLVPGWSVSGFLSSAKTFHEFFQLFTAPGIAAVVSFLVAYGHLLIGLSLLTGLLVRVSSMFAIALMLVYWMAHMDFPYISNTNNLLVDEHVVSALVLGLLIVKHAGHIWGLDEVMSKSRDLAKYPLLSWAVA